MKKAYVKPVMEGEAFVANEYVAACYWVDCACGSGCIDNELIRDVNSTTEALNAFASNHGGTVSTRASEDGTYIYKGTLAGSAGVNNDKHNESWGYWEWVRQLIIRALGITDGDIGYHHDLSVWQATAANNDGHSNASN